MNVVSFNPLREFDDFFNRVARHPGDDHTRSEWSPPVDISETEADYRINLEIPAVSAEEIEVTVKDGVLSVSGERHHENVDSSKNHRVERRYGRFTRTFKLPENAEEESISASSKDGVLYVVIAKREKETTECRRGCTAQRGGDLIDGFYVFL